MCQKQRFIVELLLALCFVYLIKDKLQFTASPPTPPPPRGRGDKLLLLLEFSLIFH